MRVLLVDDNPDSRLLMRRVLETKTSLFKVVGEASDGLEAIAQVEALDPELVVMDVRMPRMDGVEATKRIKERWPDLAVVGFSAFDDDSEEMLAAGAGAYVLKDFVGEELIMRLASVTLPA